MSNRTPALPGPEGGGANPPLPVDQPLTAAGEGVGDDVAWAQQCQDAVDGGRGVADVAHDRQAA